MTVGQRAPRKEGYLPAGWLPWQPSSSSTASSMSEAPGQWKQEQRLLWCRKLLLHSSCGAAAGSEGPALLPHPPDPAWGCPGLLALVWAGVQPLGLL